MKVDVIIPTYKPDKGFPEMIKRLEKQTLKPNRIIIMNTEEKYFEKLLYGTDLQGSIRWWRCIIFPKENSTMEEPDIWEPSTAAGIFLSA